MKNSCQNGDVAVSVPAMDFRQLLENIRLAGGSPTHLGGLLPRGWRSF